MTQLLQVALNGSRSRTELPRVPRTPKELAAEARKAVLAGAKPVRIHSFDENDHEALSAVACEMALTAIRNACPGVPVSLTTSAAIEPNPARRVELLCGWKGLPDLVTVNFGEPGAEELCHYLIGRGVGIEAGIRNVADARAFIGSGLAKQCVRVLVEPLDAWWEDAVKRAEAIENELTTAGIHVEQVHHGDQVAGWAVSARALGNGHGVRTGLEDTTLLPTGKLAIDNEQLVKTAVEMKERFGVVEGE